MDKSKNKTYRFLSQTKGASVVRRCVAHGGHTPPLGFVAAEAMHPGATSWCPVYVPEAVFRFN